MGVPAHYELVLTTQPYYTSTYVFVTRRAEHLDLHSFDDPRLRHLRIGLHAIGDDYNNGPAAQALAQRGIVDNIHGYSLYGDYSQPDPPRALIDAVARGDVDVAIAWGPTAGYFARHAAVPLDVRAVDAPAAAPPLQRTRFAIALGVRRGDTALRDRLDASLAQHRQDIAHLLARYGVPRVEGP
jgi:ABC-type amino acid transport substrate-binding protein